MFFSGFVILALLAIELGFGVSLLTGGSRTNSSQTEAPTVSIGDLMIAAR